MARFGGGFGEIWRNFAADFAKFRGFCEIQRNWRDLVEFAKFGGFCEILARFGEILRIWRNLADFARFGEICIFIPDFAKF